jgi:hypothetical protein
MRFALSRRDYEQLFLLEDLEQLAPAEVVNALRATYPRTLTGAVAELRTRGLAATAVLLEQLLVDGTVAAPGGRWHEEDIDRAALALEAAAERTPEGTTCQFLGLHPGQHVRALREARREHPDVPDSDFELRIYPAGFGFPHGDPRNDGDYSEWPYALAIYIHNPEFLEARRRLQARRPARRR